MRRRSIFALLAVVGVAASAAGAARWYYEDREGTLELDAVGCRDEPGEAYLDVRGPDIYAVNPTDEPLSLDTAIEVERYRVRWDARLEPLGISMLWWEPAGEPGIGVPAHHVVRVYGIEPFVPRDEGSYLFVVRMEPLCGVERVRVG